MRLRKGHRCLRASGPVMRPSASPWRYREWADVAPPAAPPMRVSPGAGVRTGGRLTHASRAPLQLRDRAVARARRDSSRRLMSGSSMRPVRQPIDAAVGDALVAGCPPAVSPSSAPPDRARCHTARIALSALRASDEVVPRISVTAAHPRQSRHPSAGSPAQSASPLARFARTTAVARPQPPRPGRAASATTRPVRPCIHRRHAARRAPPHDRTTSHAEHTHSS